MPDVEGKTNTKVTSCLTSSKETEGGTEEGTEEARSEQEQKKQGVSRRQHGQKQGARLPWAVVRKAANELREMGIIGGFQTTSQQRSVLICIGFE